MTNTNDVIADLDKQIETVKTRILQGDEARKRALDSGDQWKAGQFNVAVARDRGLLRDLVARRAAERPASDGAIRSSGIFYGSNS
jgi:hypothetical protein